MTTKELFNKYYETELEYKEALKELQSSTIYKICYEYKYLNKDKKIFKERVEALRLSEIYQKANDLEKKMLKEKEDWLMSDKNNKKFLNLVFKRSIFFRINRFLLGKEDLW